MNAQAPAQATAQAKRSPEEDAAKLNQEQLIAGGCSKIFTADYHKPFTSYGAAFEDLLPYHLFSDIDPEEADMDETDDRLGKNLIMSRGHAWRDHILRKAQACIAAVEPIASEMAERLKDEHSNNRKRFYEEYMSERFICQIRQPFEAETAQGLAEVQAKRQQLTQAQNDLRRTNETPQPAQNSGPTAGIAQQSQEQTQDAQQAEKVVQEKLQAEAERAAQQKAREVQEKARMDAERVERFRMEEQLEREKVQREKDARERLALLEQQQRAATVLEQERLLRDRELSNRNLASSQDRARDYPADAKERERQARERDAQARVAQFQQQQQQLADQMRQEQAERVRQLQAGQQ